MTLSKIEGIRYAIRHKVEVGQEFTTRELVGILASRHTVPTRGELANLLRRIPEVESVSDGASSVTIWRRIV